MATEGGTKHAMGIWIDTFTRPDGPIGNNWYSYGSAVGIASGLASAASSYTCIQETQSSLNYQKSIAQIYWGTGTNYHGGPCVKTSVAAPACYYCLITYVAPTATFRVYVGANNVYSVGLAAVPPPYITLAIEWNQGHIKAWYGDTLMHEFDDVTFAANLLAGFTGNRANDRFDAVTLVTDQEGAFSADPDVIGNYGACTDVELTGVGTSWTPGTPGEPIFTVNHGHISAQTVHSATSATITLCPDEYLGPITVTDPSTGLTTVVVSTSDPNIVPPGGTLSATAIEYIERSAIAQPNEPVILNQGAGIAGIQDGETLPDYFARLWHYLTGSDYTAPPYTPDPNNMPEIYARLWGGEEWLQQSFAPAGTNSIKLDVLDIIDRMQALVTDANLDLQQVLDAIAEGGGGDIQPILDLIGAPSEGEPTTLFLYLHDMLNDNPNSLFEANRKLDALRTAENLTLEQIVGSEVTEGWIPPYTTKGIWDKLLAMRGSDTADIQQAIDYALTAAEQATAAENDLNAIRTGNQYTIQSILDAIGNIPPTDIQPILDWLDTIRNGGRPSLETIMQQLEAIRTGDNLTLKSVLDAIGQDEDNPNYSALALIALLALALMGAGGTLADFIAKLATGKLDLILDIVGTLINAADFFLELWGKIDNPPPVKVSNIPSGYPGLGNVVLGEPIPFVDGINVAQVMHGALIDIETPGEHPYAIRNTQPTRYGRLGTFAFACDTERLEAIQPIQYLKLIATPKAIVNPTGLVVQCKQGTVGTVTPYTLAE